MANDEKTKAEAAKAAEAAKEVDAMKARAAEEIAAMKAAALKEIEAMKAEAKAAAAKEMIAQPPVRKTAEDVGQLLDVIVIGPEKGRRRCGMQFGPTATPVKVTGQQLAAIKADPLLGVAQAAAAS